MGTKLVSETLALPSQRVVAFLTSLALVLAVFVLGAATASPAGATSTELSVTSKINAARSARGVHRLVTQRDLVAVARAQARRMAARNRLYHNPRLAREVRNFRWVGENVGYGPTVARVHGAFMASPGHKSNVLDRDYTQVGVGAVWANGRVWIAQVFRKPLRAAAKSASAKRASSHRTLRYGSTGTAVKRVQRRLGVRPTGWFGPVTKSRVKAFQQRKGWRGSGIVGPGTWRALGL
jgi:uncharacterized protein YkwD